MDGHSQPYFSGLDYSLDFQQKEALTQGIQQVISTTPAGFESFNFRFAQRDAHIYKLVGGVILLVVTNHQLEPPTYHVAVDQLKAALESDPHSAVATFRLLAGSSTLNRPSDPAVEAAAAETASAPPPPAPPHWPEAIAALNALTTATAQYLGRVVVANTWRSTCPDPHALTLVQVDREGHFSRSPAADAPPSAVIPPAETALLHQWVQRFVQRSTLVIRNYPEIVLRQGLTAQQRHLLQIEISP
ncbi:MAG TPA: hypothetical protein V6D02_03055 [Candidatus Obscuribacterales bacterium]